MEQKDWTIAMEGLAQYYTDKCEALQAEVIDLRERLARAAPQDGGLLQQATAAMLKAERDEVERRGEKIMAQALEIGEKDAKIAKLRNTIDVLEINMRELAKRVMPSTETHFLHTKEERDSWKKQCERRDGRIQELAIKCNTRQSEIDALRQRLAYSENTVAQLRQSRDKRNHPLIGTTWKVVGYHDRRTAETQADGTVLLRDPVTGKAWTADGVRVERKTVTAQDAISEVMAVMHEDELCGDGWIEFDGGEWPVEPGIPHQAKMKSGKVCDVRYNPKIWGMPQGDDPVTHYRLVKKEAKSKQDDGWIEWHGGECPVTGHTLVRVRLRGGFESAELEQAGSFGWMDCGGHGAIIAYRLAK